MSAVQRSMFQRIDHIGVVVADLAEAEHWLADVFGLPLARTLEVPQGRIRAAFYTCGNVDIELLEIGDPEMRRQRLGPTRARIEHIAVEVQDLQTALALLAPLGVQTTQPAPRRVGDTLNVWTVAETTGGVAYQLIERQR